MPIRPRLVTIPSSDTALSVHANELLAAIDPRTTLDDACELLERNLHVRYPAAVVRPRDELADIAGDEIVWYVTDRSFRSRISATLTVGAPPAKVFAVYVERVEEWQTAVKVRLRHRSPVLVGSEWSATWEFLGARAEGTLRLVEADPPHFVRFEAVAGPIHLWYATSFTPSGAGTIVRVVGDYNLPDGLLPKILDRLFIERSIQRQIDSAHEELAALCAAQRAVPAAS